MGNGMGSAGSWGVVDANGKLVFQDTPLNALLSIQIMNKQNGICCL